jgi:long-chain acyl-CoA synthetase
MKANIGVNSQSKLIHSVVVTSAHVHDSLDPCRWPLILDAPMQTDAGLADVLTLNELIEQFRTHTDAAAIMTLDRSGSVVTYTYSHIAREISRLAAGLTRNGLSDGALIMLWAPNSPEWVIAFFAITAAGNVAIPLDDQISAAGLDAVLRHSRPACVFTTAQHLPMFEACGISASARCILLDDDRTDIRGWRSLCSEEVAGQVPAPGPQDVASLLYTSGTTGPPKAVPLTHANLMSNVRAIVAADIITHADRVLLPLPLHHAYPATVGMLCALGCGAALILPPGISGPELTMAARQAGATVLIGVPRLYAAFMESIEAGIRGSGYGVRRLYPLLLRASIALRRGLGMRVGGFLFRGIHKRVGAGLRILASGGARLEPELAWKLNGLGWEVLTGYGLTETSPVVTFNTPDRKRLDSQGIPLSGVEVDVEKAPGESYGEILVKGPNVFSGYWMDDAATREAFTKDGWFRTGDLGLIDPEGFLHVVGRSKEIIVLADGKNVVPEDIERVYEDSPFIREVAVLERGGALAAIVVPDDEAVRNRGAMSEEALLREEVESAMFTVPSYQRIAEYRLTRWTLPRTQLGKLRRHLLPEIFEKARGAEARTSPAVLRKEDRQLLRSATVGTAWQWLQERYAGRSITLDSSPQLDLGIDSLAWVSVTSELEDKFGIVLGGEALSRVLTVRDLLYAIDAASRDLRVTTRSELQQSRVQRYLENPTLPWRVLRWLLVRSNRIVMRSYFRLRNEGLNRLPSAGAFVITPNHTSYLDPLAIAAALPNRLLSNTCWAGWAGMMHKGPVFRAISRASRVFPVDPDQELGGGVQLGAQALHEGRVLVWFPEGRRSQDGAVLPFRRGIGVLLEESRAKVVPVRIRGSFEAWPPKGKWPRLRPITVVFGWPQTVDSLLAEGRGEDAPARISDALERRVRDLSA